MTVNTDMTRPGCVTGTWLTACASGSCVEVAIDTHCGLVEVRDSKNPFADVLRYTTAEWVALTGEILASGRIPYVVSHDEHRVWIGKTSGGEYKVLIFDRQEIAEFVAAVFAGKFRVPAVTAETEALHAASVQAGV